jgi:hypothetical protein
MTTQPLSPSPSCNPSRHWCTTGNGGALPNDGLTGYCERRSVMRDVAQAVSNGLFFDARHTESPHQPLARLSTTRAQSSNPHSTRSTA